MNTGMEPSQALLPIELMLKNVQEVPDQLWLRQPLAGGEKQWTWKQAAEEVRRLATAIAGFGFAPGARIAISGRNTAHWFLADMAIAMAGHVSVGLYPKQAASNTRYILAHCDAQAVFVGPADDAEVLMSSLPAGVTTIAMPYPGIPECELSWDSLIQHPPLADNYRRPAADSLVTLVYTSGTTGHPKGVMITVANLLFSAPALLQWFPAGRHERLLSYLPLAHLLERMTVEFASLAWQAEVCFLSDLDKLAEELQQIAPSRFIGVPLVYGRIQAGILAVKSEKRLRRILGVPVFGQFVRRKILKKIGLQNARTCLATAAPTPVSTIRFFREILGIEILEGYGMTENTAYLSAGLPGQACPGTVGKPFADAGVRIADDGEIQCRHAGCSPGYYKDEARTAELYTEDGYLRTGDKGSVDADGYLRITGRVKDIFKTAKGKYVSPAPIENALARNSAIDQLCLVGMHLTQPIMVASLSDTSRHKHPGDIESGLLEDMAAVNAQLEPHERMAKILITKDQWLPDNGFMTPTMKVKRAVVEERYRQAIFSAIADRDRQIVWL